MADLFHALPKIGRKRMAASAFVQFEFSDLSRIIVHTGMELCCPAKSEEMTMRALSFFFAGLAVAIISIAPANAEKTTMLHYDVASYFAFSVQQTCSHQLRRRCEDGDGQGLATLRRLVGGSNQGFKN